jgi:hypothetical protein
MRLQYYLPRGRFWDITISLMNAWRRLGYFPNIFKPKTMNEYILAQKLSFGGDLKLAKRVTNKANLKFWLSEIGFERLTVPTLGLYYDINKLSLDHFNDEVIAKPIHSSGSIMIRKAIGNNPFTVDDLKIMSRWMEEDYYIRSREQNYKDISRGIIIEPFLRDQNNKPLKDYKVYCSSGNPFMIQVDHERFDNHTRQLYTAEWDLLPYSMCYPRNDNYLEKPQLLTEALEIAKVLSKKFSFVRIDFYFINNILKIGELTFFPGNGAERFNTIKGDLKIGQLYQLAKPK